MDPSILRRLQKLYRLAEGGVSGEKDNAERMLYKTLEKYDLDLSDVVDGEVQKYVFNYKTALERSLLQQIAHRVFDSGSIEFYQRGRGRMVFELTKVQYIEFNVLYETLKPELIREIEETLDAFIAKHELYSSGTNKRELSEEEMERLRRIAEKMKTMKDVPIRKQLT